jgi:conjugative relaxase-like TrwC/TraI family protein
MAYFNEGLSKDDYYGKQDVGHWQGEAAKKIGLVGEVSPEQFGALVANRHPRTGERLTPRDRERCPGYDFTFSVPKSVSVLYALTGDKRIREAFQASVVETMHDVEAEALTRVRRNGANSERTTGNLAWAAYTHFTSRPIGGVPDPHLHLHAYVFSLTHDSEENVWKAVQFRELKRDAPFWESSFDARLAKRLSDMGFATDRTAKGWEVAGIPPGVCRKFSRRTAEIEAEAERRGITSDKEKDRLGAKTRKGKADIDSTTDPRKEWLSRLDPEERRAISDLTKGLVSLPKGERVTAASALDHAIEHSFERASVTPEKRLMAEALKRGVGSVLPEDIKREIQSRPDLLVRKHDGQSVATTRQVLAEEQRLVRFAREGRGTCKPLGPYAPAPGLSLSDDQEKAVRAVLSSGDRVTLFRGRAGTGKTRSLTAVVAGAEASGREVFVVAPGSQAARGVLRSEGFEKAETVAHLLSSKEMQSEIREGDVLLVDEAGTLGSRDMNRVFDLAGRTGSRVLLVGDTQQHSSVPRGDALRVLQNQSGIQPAELKEIRRQAGEYRIAVEHLSRGDTAAGLERLDRMGALREVAGDVRYQRLAADYLKAREDGKSALVVAPTHAEGDRVGGVIRRGLRDRGHLEGPDRSVCQYRSLHLTAAQKRDAANYRPGDVVQFGKRVGAFRRNERAVVESVTDGKVSVRRSGRPSSTALPLDRAGDFEVYQQGQLPLATGDTIRLSANGTTLDGRQKLNNGSFHRVDGFTREGHIRLEGGKVIDRDYAHLAHGYTTTSHSSQGATVDRVFLAQSSMSWGASSQEQVYVSVSRGRESVTIYTDSKEDLKAAVRRSSERLSATELMTPTGRIDERQKGADSREKPDRISDPTQRPESARIWSGWHDRLRQMRRRVLERTYARQRDSESVGGPKAERSREQERTPSKTREVGR